MRKIAGNGGAVILIVSALLILRHGAGGAFHAQAASAPLSKTDGRCPAGTVFVPGGDFLMGTDETLVEHLARICSRYMGGCLREWFEVEAPRRSVYVPPFCIERCETPNSKGNLPSGGLNWMEADARCRLAGRQLCTEAQWEKACAGAEGAAWSYGPKYSPGACNIAGDGLKASGSSPECSSGYGAEDMNGNLMEWTADSVEAAAGKRIVRKEYVMKGGSWKSLAFFTRCASREFYAPSLSDATFGARCCVKPGGGTR
ncbi:MAG: formylglycine-generating enzyme family protein [bacterium]